MTEEIKKHCGTCEHGYLGPGYEPCRSCTIGCSNWTAALTIEPIRISKEAKDEEEPEKHDIMVNVTADIHRNLMDSYDQLIAKCFRKYGIELDLKDREALEPWTRRIKVDILNDDTLVEVWQLDGIELFRIYRCFGIVTKNETSISVEARHVVEFTWQECQYAGLKLQHNGTWIDGAWYEWKDTDGNIEKARMKLDAYDHFFPDTRVIKEENVVAYRPFWTD